MCLYMRKEIIKERNFYYFPMFYILMLHNKLKKIVDVVIPDKLLFCVKIIIFLLTDYIELEFNILCIISNSLNTIHKEVK